MIKFSKTNYIGNESGLACEIGDIFQRDSGNFIWYGNIFHDIEGLNRDSLIRTSNPYTFTLTSESGVTIDFEAGYGVPLQKSEVRIRFANKHSAFVHLNNAVTHSLAIENIRAKLYKHWRQRGYINDVRRYCLVHTLMQAGEGKIIFSKCNNTSVTLAHRQGLEISTLEGLIDARVSITREASSVGTIDTTNVAQPIVQMVRWYNSLFRDRFKCI